MKRRMEEEEEKVAPYRARREASAWKPGSAGPTTEPPPRPPPPPQPPPPLPPHRVEAAGQPAARWQMSGPNTSRWALTACCTTTTTTTILDTNQVSAHVRLVRWARLPHTLLTLCFEFEQQQTQLGEFSGECVRVCWSPRTDQANAGENVLMY